ncbi:MAG: hypothetical protein JW751_21095 [Polyangiaceae bacterium]|nr:hypothetical protein [Polyangiaceae bacterium]
MNPHSSRPLRPSREAGIGVAFVVALATRAAFGLPNPDPPELPDDGVGPVPATDAPPEATEVPIGIPTLEEAMRARMENPEAAFPPGAPPPPYTTYDMMMASPIETASLSSTSHTYRNPGAMIGGDLVLPTGLIEVGGEILFVTSDHEVGGEPLELTDLGLLRLHARRALLRRFEVFAATELLAKRPRGLEAPVWQGALGGARLAFADHFASVVSGGGGPLLTGEAGRDGHHWEFGSHLEYRPQLDENVYLELDLGTETTGLALHPKPAAPFWVEELTARLVALRGGDRGGLWIAVDYRLPYARSPRRLTWDGRGLRTLDPGPGLGLEIGAVLSVEQRGWDLFAVVSWIDRGDPARPSTMLPILHGGFDSWELSLGLQHRFEILPDPERQMRRIERRRARGEYTPLP